MIDFNFLYMKIKPIKSLKELAIKLLENENLIYN